MGAWGNGAPLYGKWVGGGKGALLLSWAGGGLGDSVDIQRDLVHGFSVVVVAVVKKTRGSRVTLVPVYFVSALRLVGVRSVWMCGGARKLKKEMINVFFFRWTGPCLANSRPSVKDWGQRSRRCWSQACSLFNQRANLTEPYSFFFHLPTVDRALLPHIFDQLLIDCPRAIR